MPLYWVLSAVNDTELPFSKSPNRPASIGIMREPAASICLVSLSMTAHPMLLVPKSSPRILAIFRLFLRLQKYDFILIFNVSYCVFNVLCLLGGCYNKQACAGWRRLGCMGEEWLPLCHWEY